MNVVLVLIYLAQGAKLLDEYVSPEKNLGHWYEAKGLRNFQEQREKCVWGEKIPAVDFFDEFEYALGAEDWNTKGPGTIYVQECQFADVERPDEIWTIRRLGPYITDGGEEWHKTKYVETMPPRWMTGRAFARYDEEDNLLSYPPIHVHHEHLAYNECLPDYLPFTLPLQGSRIGVSHGDDNCPGENGIACSMYKSLPEGTGKRISKYWYDTKLGDNRKPGSPDLTWYSEIALRTTPVPKTTLMHLSYFSTGSLTHLVNVPLPEGLSLFWHSFRFSVAGTMETVWSHMHGAQKIYMFKGHPKDFNIGHKYSKVNDHTPLQIDDIEKVSQDIENSAKANKIEWCEGQQRWENVDYPDVEQKSYVRQTVWNCGDWHFEKDDVVVLLAFYDLIQKEVAVGSWQHLAARFEYYLDNEEDFYPELETNNLIFCGENPDECLHVATLGYKFAAIFFYDFYAPPERWYIPYLAFLVLSCILFGFAYGSFRLIQTISSCLKRKKTYTVVQDDDLDCETSCISPRKWSYQV